MTRIFQGEAFRNNHVFPLGPNVTGLEDDLKRFTGSAACSCLASGTAAIHLALIILGVEQGDEVICSSFTFSASANPIVYLKATPVFVDSEPDTWNLKPDNPGYCRKATFLATQARDAAPHYQHSHIGYNYRMSNICAGIGRGQMEVLEQRIEKRRENFFFYKASLEHLSSRRRSGSLPLPPSPSLSSRRRSGSLPLPPSPSLSSPRKRGLSTLTRAPQVDLSPSSANPMRASSPTTGSPPS
ncbi:MAG: DegT/DnrJ/EryC1/StrS family aminotransferase [Bacteroidia bacterium]|nr:DegT/DnrJ/EryC1/StrS family aminotransferase [Bacteroidia bacterium]